MSIAMGGKGNLYTVGAKGIWITGEMPVKQIPTVKGKLELGFSVVRLKVTTKKKCLYKLKVGSCSLSVSCEKRLSINTQTVFETKKCFDWSKLMMWAQWFLSLIVKNTIKREISKNKLVIGVTWTYFDCGYQFSLSRSKYDILKNLPPSFLFGNWNTS